MNQYTTEGTILSVNGVSLELGGKLILDGVDFKIEDIVRPGVTQGQVCCLLGPSGIGKTQLFLCMAGLQNPTSGSITVTKKNVPVKKGMVGVVSQKYLLFEHRKTLGNLVVAAKRKIRDEQEEAKWSNPFRAFAQVLRNWKTRRVEARNRSNEMLQRFGLEERANFYPDQLSGGQRQRIAIAQQLLCSEHFLLMDEPFSGLDPIMVDEVCALVKEVSNAHEFNTTIIVTHDVRAAVEVADKLLLMGRDRNERGEATSGAYIKYVKDLAAEGLAWTPDITSDPRFHEAVRQIEHLFRDL